MESNIIEMKDMTLDLVIEDKVCILRQDSGSGKTYLFECLYNWGRCNKKKVIRFSSRYTPENLDIVKAMCNSADIVIFDNADLYCSYDMIQIAESLARLVLVSVKYRCETGKYPCYVCEYTPGTIKVRKVG